MKLFVWEIEMSTGTALSQHNNNQQQLKML